MTTRADGLSSLSVAEKALARIKELGLPADPANFQLWYAYASGDKPELTSRVDRILQSRGSLSNDDVARLSTEFFAAGAPEVALDTAGSQISEEVDQIVSLIKTAMTTTAKHGDEIAGASSSLAQPIDSKMLRLVVEQLLRVTRGVESENVTFGTQLNQARQHIRLLQRNLRRETDDVQVDALTHLPNRQRFEQLLQEAIAQSRQDSAALSIALCDIDHFKRYNESYGTQNGDYVIRLIAEELKQSLKGQDIVARYGGGEFAVILPNTSLLAAVTVAEILRRAVAERQVLKRATGENLGRVTISLGVAQFQPKEAALALLERAEACLLEAKSQGRNRVVDEQSLASAQSWQRVEIG